MADMSDWLNRKVLSLRFDPGSELAELQVDFQDGVRDEGDPFGTKRQLQARIGVACIHLDMRAVDDFLSRAGAWLALPIEQLGTTYFAGHWELGDRSLVHRLALTFDRYEKTMSKTDWFDVRLHIGVGQFSWGETWHVDRSALALFVQGLKMEKLARLKARRAAHRESVASGAKASRLP